MSETENQETPNLVGSSSLSVPIEAGEPHQALFLILSYLPLFELLSISAVCVSLRDAVERDVLRYQIIVDRPLSSRLTDETLRRIARKANGRLTTLALVNCLKITDSGLHEVVEKNPLLSKLYLPGCSGLTPDGVVRAVKTLCQYSHNLKSLMVGGIGGIFGIKNEHLEVLQSHLQENQPQQQQQQQRSLLYHERLSGWKLVNDEFHPLIDVQMCRKCKLVVNGFGCSRERCKKKQDKLQGDCWGCIYCVPKCGGCGGCLKSDEENVAICGCIICSSCWLYVPKCSHCDRPICNRHSDEVSIDAESSELGCNFCQFGSLLSVYPCVHDYDSDYLQFLAERHH